MGRPPAEEAAEEAAVPWAPQLWDDLFGFVLGSVAFVLELCDPRLQDALHGGEGALGFFG